MCKNTITFNLSGHSHFFLWNLFIGTLLNVQYITLWLLFRYCLLLFLSLYNINLISFIKILQTIFFFRHFLLFWWLFIFYHIHKSLLTKISILKQKLYIWINCIILLFKSKTHWTIAFQVCFNKTSSMKHVIHFLYLYWPIWFFLLPFVYHFIHLKFITYGFISFMLFIIDQLTFIQYSKHSSEFIVLWLLIKCFYV